MDRRSSIWVLVPFDPISYNTQSEPGAVATGHFRLPIVDCRRLAGSDRIITNCRLAIGNRQWDGPVAAAPAPDLKG
ncbi:MAG TPA: hypothetical protein VFD48_07510 [Pyrinomonadaceae bacterium]|nr:hypothetical protein [Pyrinomonadaceae bacterium]